MLGDSLYLENLREFVEDENRIVTYKWLSRKLEVPTDAAKKMLYTYVTKRGSSAGVTATYVITGLKATNHGKMLQVLLVRGKELEAAKTGFLSVMTVHVYSVQKTGIQDSSALFLADHDICKERISSYSRWSPISSSVRRPASSSTLPQQQPPPTSTAREKAVQKEKKSKFPQLQVKSQQAEKKDGHAKVITERKQDVAKSFKIEAVKPVPKRPDPKKVSEGKQKKGNVAAFFNKPGAVKTVAKKTEKVAEASVKKSTGAFLNDSDIDDVAKSSKIEALKPVPKRPDPKKVSEGKQKKGNVAAFFNKPGAVKTVAKKTEKVAEASVKKSTGAFLNDSDIDDGSDSGGDSVLPAAPKPKASVKVAPEKRASDTAAKATSQPRKRKRVQNTMSSDEEGDVEEKYEAEKAGVQAGGRRRRKRVKRLKSKMYTTDDGAMVTEKVWESESTDDSEPEAKPQTRGEKKGPAKPVQTSPPKATKQSLLSSFFKNK